jgi:hypothetical protein
MYRRSLAGLGFWLVACCAGAVAGSDGTNLQPRNLSGLEVGAQAATEPQPAVQTERVVTPEPDRSWQNSLGMKFVPVPGTKVLFCVWETRVRDFAAFVGETEHDAGNAMHIATSNSWELRAGFNWRNPGFQQGPTYPVVGVNYDDAQAFCRWLTEREQKAALLRKSQQYRLPTDLEWSRAVGLEREPGNTPQERFVQVRDLFPWGTNALPPNRVGNLAPSLGVDAFERTAPVGRFAPNRYGLFDLVGNVSEWCEDWWNEQQRFRVLRGSGWHTDCVSCLLSSYRYPNLPDLRIDYYGFRVVVDLDLEPPASSRK